MGNPAKAGIPVKPITTTRPAANSFLHGWRSCRVYNLPDSDRCLPRRGPARYAACTSGSDSRGGFELRLFVLFGLRAGNDLLRPARTPLRSPLRQMVWRLFDQRLFIVRFMRWRLPSRGISGENAQLVWPAFLLDVRSAELQHLCEPLCQPRCDHLRTGAHARRRDQEGRAEPE